MVSGAEANDGHSSSSKATLNPNSSTSPFTISSASSATDSQFTEDVDANLLAQPNTEFWTCVAGDDLEAYRTEYGDASDKVLPYAGKREPRIGIWSLLSTMLNWSSLSGGDGYVGCAIASCAWRTKPDSSLLESLADTWFTHFLYPMHRLYARSSPYVNLQMRTFQSDPLKLALLDRDGYRCVATQIYDGDYRPPKGKDNRRVHTHAAHILPKTFNRMDNELQFTRGILRRFAPRIHYGDIADTLIDRPENGITLSLHLHVEYDTFRWCFIPTEQENTYRFTPFDVNPIHLPHTNRVIFSNHSTSKRSIPLPRRDFIELHAALTHIIHTSGAGPVIDEFVADYNQYAKITTGPRGDPLDFKAVAAVMALLRSGRPRAA